MFCNDALVPWCLRITSATTIFCHGAPFIVNYADDDDDDINTTNFIQLRNVYLNGDYLIICLLFTQCNSQ